MIKRRISACLCGVAALLLLAACGNEKQPEGPETNADGMTRPVALTEAKVPLTDEHGAAVTGADGRVVMVDKPKVAEGDGQSTTRPLASNDWAQTAARSGERPFDLYKPGDPAKNSPTQIDDFVQSGRVAWPLAKLPAALPVAAQYIDRLDDRSVDGARQVTLYVTEMPYKVFLAYAANLKKAGFVIESEMLPAEAPVLKLAMLTGKLGQLDVILAWTPPKATGFIANFQLQIEGTGF